MNHALLDRRLAGYRHKRTSTMAKTDEIRLNVLRVWDRSGMTGFSTYNEDDDLRPSGPLFILRVWPFYALRPKFGPLSARASGNIMIAIYSAN